MVDPKRPESGEYAAAPSPNRILCSTCRARQRGTYACPDCAGRGFLTRAEFAQLHARGQGRPFR